MKSSIDRIGEYIKERKQAKEKLENYYREVNKTEVEQNWKFANLIIVLSIGILAFSIQTIFSLQAVEKIKINWPTDAKLFISWIVFFFAFFFGFCRIFHLQKSFSKETRKLAAEVYREEPPKENKWTEFVTETWVGKLTYILMGVCFMVGIILFVLYMFCDFGLKPLSN
jgi:hypothetical protein